MTRTPRVLAIVSTLLGFTFVASAEEQPQQEEQQQQQQPQQQSQQQSQQQQQSQDQERAMSQVYFDFDSATSTADLLPVANQLQCNPNDTIVLDAYTDPVGSEEYNVDLAIRRAENVRDRLVDLGIDRDRIMLGIFGENGPRHDKHAYDRRVEIRSSNEPVATLQQRRQSTAVAVVQPGQEPEQVARP